MQRLIPSLILSCALAVPVLAALPVGEKAPDFTAQASLAGEAFTFSLDEALRQGPAVVYFFPSAYTRGCNIQAHTFAESMDRFNEAGATVVGVSLDSIERLNDFSADPEYCAGKLAVVSDEDGGIAQSYELSVSDGRPGMKDTRGVEIDHGFAERTTFIINQDGTIAATVSDVAPEQNVEQSLQHVQQLAAK